MYRILTSPYVGGVKIQTTCKNIQQYHKPKRLVRYIYCNGSKVSWTATGLLHRSVREESEHKSLHSGLIEKYLWSALWLSGVKPNWGKHSSQPKLGKISKIIKPFEVLEKSNDQVAIGFSFDSDWLRKWREFPGPIIGFTSFRCVIGLENSHHDSLNQSAANLETIETWSLGRFPTLLFISQGNQILFLVSTPGKIWDKSAHLHTTPASLSNLSNLREVFP